MHSPSTLSTRTAKPPATKAPGGFHYVCHSVQPLTGQPKDADGKLILSYRWHLERKDGKPFAHAPVEPVPAPETPVRPVRPQRGLQQADLFGE